MGIGIDAESMNDPSRTPHGPRGISQCWVRFVSFAKRDFRLVQPFPLLRWPLLPCSSFFSLPDAWSDPPCSVFPSSRSSACGTSGNAASRELTAPAGLPGTLITSAAPSVPHTARLKLAIGVSLRPSARINSATPSSSRSHTVRVASGVTSRGPMPVPPVVTTKRAMPAAFRIASSIRSRSSGTVTRDTVWKPFASNVRAKAGPDRSSRSPRAQLSLTVMTAALLRGDP